MKYITYDDGADETPILFDDCINHDNMALAVSYLCQSKFILLGAGFVRLNRDTNLIECFGESVSLGIPSRGDKDTCVVVRFLKKRNF